MPTPSDAATEAGLSGLLGLAASRSPDKLAVVEAEGPDARGVTWGELEDEVGRVATGLGSAGVVAGHRIMLALGNRVEFVVAYLAALRVQAVVVPVNPRGSRDELVRTLADSGSRLVLADAGSVTVVREAVARLTALLDGPDPADPADPAPPVDRTAEASPPVPPEVLARARRPRVVVVGATLRPGERSYDHLRASAPSRPHPPLRDPEALAVLLYTSGTSGRPRAAMLSHRALRANLEQVAAVDPPMIHGDDVVLGALPLFHVYGLNAVLGGVLRHRAKLVLVDRFDPLDALDLIEDQACSVVPVAPPVFTAWRHDEHLEERLGPVRLLLSGAAPLAPELVEEVFGRTRVVVHQGYGLTEAAPIVTSTLCSRRLQAGSVGAALPGIELRLVDEAGRAPEGEDPGEIHVRGANLFSGYWPDGDDGPDADGWWATGDVGFLDESGDLFLVDRVKEVVIVSGFNVYPAEVEDVVREVVGVREVAVVASPDPTTGETVVAYVRAPGQVPEEVEAAIRFRCDLRLARFKRPTRIEVVDALPLTVTGKVQKGVLRAAERRRAEGPTP